MNQYACNYLLPIIAMNPSKTLFMAAVSNPLDASPSSTIAAWTKEIVLRSHGENKA
jgi:hypothetical protein